jgi:hypothetical protein
VGFYDDVLRELLVALGAALFLGNLLALLRRRFPAGRPRPGDGEADALSEAPLARTVAYLVIGLVVAVWGIASLAAS